MSLFIGSMSLIKLVPKLIWLIKSISDVVGVTILIAGNKFDGLELHNLNGLDKKFLNNK